MRADEVRGGEREGHGERRWELRRGRGERGLLLKRRKEGEKIWAENGGRSEE